jgi:hypothetical protein
MKHLNLLVIAFCLITHVTTIQAQNTIPATGGNASGVGGSASYTVGQIAYDTNTGTNGSVAEGVQQPYEISVVVGIEKARYTNIHCTVYPNPATDLLTLEVEIPDSENLVYQLYDMMGKLLVSKKLIDIKTNISMREFAPATYVLKVTDNQKVVETFKIIKNQ